MTYNPNFAGKVTVDSVQITEYNQTGSTISKLTPIKIDASGTISTVSVSIESDVFSIAGLLTDDVSNNSTASITVSGRIVNVSTSIDVGSSVYLSKTGSITEIKPNIGAGGFEAGDFVVKVGMIVKNASNPLNKDVLVHVQIIGQL